jgi:fumarate reductase iron-sulfur subunit
MKITIKRFDKHKEPQSIQMSYPIFEGLTLLENFIKIKTTIDPTLSFSGVCRSGVCGSCAVMVNGKTKLACNHIPNDGDYIEPLMYHEAKRDLIVEKSKAQSTITTVKAWLHGEVKKENANKAEIQSSCILCDSCFASCPVMAVNKDFLGPFALTKAYRYSIQGNNKETIDLIQKNGVWDCTLCGECTLACPQGIDPKTDIMNLRSISAQYGYSDPNFANMSFGFGGFGFN